MLIARPPVIRFEQLPARDSSCSRQPYTCCMFYNILSPDIFREHLARAPAEPLRRIARLLPRDRDVNEPTDQQARRIAIPPDGGNDMGETDRLRQ